MPRSIASLDFEPSPRRRRIPLLDDPSEDTESLLQSIAGTALSGLEAVGNLLDLGTGSSSLRDVLAGENPFDQFLTPLSATNRVSGRDLLTKWGLARKNKETGLDFGDPLEMGRDFAGFGAELVLSPGSFFTKGLSNAGQVARNAGVLDDVGKVAGRSLGKRAALARTTIGDLLEHSPDSFDALAMAARAKGMRLRDIADQPLGGSFGFTLPFKRDAIGVLNSDRYNAVMDAVGDAVSRNPLTSFLAKHFDAPSKGAETKIGRSLARDVTRAENAIDAQQAYKGVSQVHDLQASGFFDDYASLDEGMDDLARMIEGHKPAPAKAAGVVNGIRSEVDELMREGKAAGLSLSALDDLKSDYLHALLIQDDAPGLMAGSKQLSVGIPMSKARSGLFRDVGEGRATLRSVSREAPSLRQAVGGDKKQFIREFEKKHSAKIPGFQRDVNKAVERAVALAESDIGLKGATVADDIAAALAPEFIHKLPGENTISSIAKAVADEANTRAEGATGKLGQLAVNSMGNKPLLAAMQEKFGESNLVRQMVDDFVGAAGSGAANVVDSIFSNPTMKNFATDAWREFSYAPGKLRKRWAVTKDALKAKYGKLLPGGEATAEKLFTRIKKSLPKAITPDNLHDKLLPEMQDHVAAISKAVNGITDPVKLKSVLESQITPKLTDEWRQLKQGNMIGRTGRRTKLASWLFDQKDETLSKGMFADAITAHQRGSTITRQKIATANDVIDTLIDSNALKHAARESTKQGLPDVKMGDLLESLKFNTNLSSPESVFNVMAERLAKKGQVVTAESLRNSTVPGKLAQDLGAISTVIARPETQHRIAELIGYGNNLMKAHLTSPWPAFNVRNLTSGVVHNLAQGLAGVKDHFDAMALLKGKTIKGAEKIPFIAKQLAERGLPVDSEHGTEVLRELAYSHRASGRGQGMALADSEVGTMLDLSPLDQLPGEVPATPVKDYLAGLTFKKGERNPLDIENFGPIKGGRKAGEFVEGVNRIAPFLAQMRKGVDPAEAMRRTLAAQVDYGGRNYTPFERNVMQKLFPFYKFTRGILPDTFKELLEHPGGATAAGIRGLNQAHDPDTTLPEHVANGAAIPLGVQPDGTRRYLAGLGLMEEGAVNMFPTSVRSGLRNVAGQLNPVLRGPLEWMTGQSFFQDGQGGTGRPLADMDPILGRVGANLTGEDDPYKLDPLLEHVVASSPASRLLNTIKTWGDDRKGVLAAAGNTLTGLRVTDVSPGAQESVLRDLLQEALRQDGARAFEEIYFPDGADVSPQDETILDLIDELAARSKARRKAKAMN